MSLLGFHSFVAVLSIGAVLEQYFVTLWLCWSPKTRTSTNEWKRNAEWRM